MAVVQISRIQQRRGKKLEGSGFPQLASGEIGWAIDTQELYIGNGAVSEGAPYVGNTQILTEHVNILDFAEAYQYKNVPGSNVRFTVPRSLQDRLDNYVSVREFGVVGDGNVDDTLALQHAIDQLFLVNNNVEDRVILFFEPGIYKITAELKIPPYAHLSGSGIDSTVIYLENIYSNLLNGDAVMKTISGDSSPGNYIDFSSMKYLERPRYIFIEKMTLQTEYSDAILRLENVDRMTLDYVKFVGTYKNGNSPNENLIGYTCQSGIYVRSTSSVFRTENVSVTNCQFTQTGYGVFSECDHSNVSFINCTFSELFDGVSIGGNGSISIDVSSNPIPTNAVSVTNDTILIENHGYVENQVVLYQSGVFSIAGLVEENMGGNTFYYNVIVIDNNNYGLSYDPDGLVLDLLSQGNSNQYIQTQIGNEIHPINPASVNLTTNTINEPNHGFTQNTLVNYKIGIYPINGLIDGKSYYVKVIDNDKFKLCNVAGGDPIDLQSTGNNSQYIASNIPVQGAVQSEITNSYFDLIDRYGIWVKFGSGNTSTSNKFINVGNNNNGYSSAEYPNVRYDNANNQSVNDYFERNSKLKNHLVFSSTPFIPPLQTTSLIIDQTNFRKQFSVTLNTPLEFFRFPANKSSTYVVDYVMNLFDTVNPLNIVSIRTGRLHITTNINTFLCNINDDFSYNGDAKVELVKFTTDLVSVDDTLIINLFNPDGNGNGFVTYAYRTLSQ